MSSPFGQECIIDVHKTFHFDRKAIAKFCRKLCKLIDMEREDLYFWDYKGDPKGYQKAPDHLKGTSAVQFISTSNITVHTLDVMRRMYINVFSCKPFNPEIVREFVVRETGGKVVNFITCTRV